MEKFYYSSLVGITQDLSNKSVLDTSISPNYLGKSVCISSDGTYSFISSQKSVVSSTTNHDGDVHVYSYNSANRTWSYETSLYPVITSSLSNHQGSSGVYSAEFGYVMQSNSDGSVLYIGIPGYRISNLNVGAVCVLQRIGSYWSVQQFIENQDSNGSSILANIRFGSTLSIRNTNTLFIGTDANSYTNSNVYKFDYISGSFTKDFSFSIKPTNAFANSNFGTSISSDLSGTTLVVGSVNFGRTVNSSTYYTGSTHVFQYSSGSWSQIQDLYEDISNNPPYNGATIANGAKIGENISMSQDGDKIVVSTFLNGVSSGTKYGVIYYFQYDTNQSKYVYRQHLVSPAFNTLSSPFGSSLHINDQGTYLATSHLNKHIYVYYYDSSTYWTQNQTHTQTIVNDISSTEYAHTTILNGLGNSIALSGNGRFLLFGVKNYRYNDPTSSSSPISGQAIILYGKHEQTIDNFDDLSQGYDVVINLAATTNGSSTTPIYTDPDDPTSNGNSVYTFDSSSTIQILGLGTESLNAAFSGDDDYLPTNKTINVTGNQVDQNINYTAAISTQGSIGVGQPSGLVYEVLNAESGGESDLSGTLSITGKSVTFNPITSEVEGLYIGSSIVTISQTGNLYYNSAVPVSITYNVQSNWSSPYPTNFNVSFVPNEDGLDFQDTLESTIISSPGIGSIAQNVALGMTKRTIDDNQVIYSIETLNSKENYNDLKRTSLGRNGSAFRMSVQDISGNIDYMTVSLREPSVQIPLFSKMTLENKTMLSNLPNKTDIIQIKKYVNTSGNEYASAGNDTQYVTVRIYNPYNTCDVYHIDDNNDVLQVIHSNFPESMIRRDVFDTDYWFVKMPFSYAVATPGTYNSNNNSEDLICFLQGTNITCKDLETYKEIEVPIESIKKGMLVKTYKHGYVPVNMIACRTMKNMNDYKREKNRLYKCSPAQYESLYEDLFITGCHSILEDAITDKQYEVTQQLLGEFFITDGKCRLMAICDPRAKPYASNEECVIWHICLDHEDELMNYGIYANGLLVESCSEVNIQNPEYVPS
jgi:hypothetical protein